MTNKLLSKPTLQGMMRESSSYQVMNVGVTDTVLLLGHADANIMYEPYQVIDIQKAINFLGADTNSPLLRAMLELYNGGCKDIWLYAAAPMSEYNSDITDRLVSKVALGNKTFYQKYYDRLTAAYAAMSSWDFIEVVVPVEAVFYDAGVVDFATQLIDFCGDAFQNTGTVALGVLGTRIAQPSPTTTAIMAADTRIKNFSADGKFVMVVVGEGIIKHPQMSISYLGSLSTQVATLISAGKLDRSIAGLRLPNCSALMGPNYNSDDLELLTQAKLNPVVRSQRGKRGAAFEQRLLTDNTLGQDGSDFWSMAQMHIVATCINKIREYGYNFIGETKTDRFKEVVNSYLNSLARNAFIRDYSLSIAMSERNSIATVAVGLSLIFGIRNIFFTCIVGPGI